MSKNQTPKLPRALDEIQKDYGVVAGRLADAEYKSFIHQEEAAEYKQEMKRLNNEAHARNQLEAQKKAEKEAAEAKAEENKSGAV